MGQIDSSKPGVGDSAKFILLMFVVVLIWAASWWWVQRYFGDTPGLPASAVSPEVKRGLFGDQFGAVNSLFSGLALAGVIFTVLLQRRELALQRKQLSESADLFEIQRFESTFFKLLDLHAQITASLVAPGETGRKAHYVLLTDFMKRDPEFSIFRSLSKIDREDVRRIKARGAVAEGEYQGLTIADVSTLTDALATIPASFDSFLDSNLEMHAAKVKRAYETAFVAYLDNFAHYFRSLYHLLKFVDGNSALNQEAKRKYATIVRSQLSDTELLSVFYNSMMRYEVAQTQIELGYPKMTKMLVRYDILQNMARGNLFHPIHWKVFEVGVANAAA